MQGGGVYIPSANVRGCPPTHDGNCSRNPNVKDHHLMVKSCQHTSIYIFYNILGAKFEFSKFESWQENPLCVLCAVIQTKIQNFILDSAGINQKG